MDPIFVTEVAYYLKNRVLYEVGRLGLPEKLKLEYIQIGQHLSFILDGLEFVEKRQVNNLKEQRSELRNVCEELNGILDKMNARCMIQEYKRVKHPKRQVMLEIFPIDKVIFNNGMIRDAKEIESTLQHKVRAQIRVTSSEHPENSSNLVPCNNVVGRDRDKGILRVTNSEHPENSSTLVPCNNVVGRDRDKGILRDKLCINIENEVDVRVISIVGKEGIGKTLLARLVYDDEAVKYLFPARAWVDVSRDYDVMATLKNIYEQVSKKPGVHLSWDVLLGLIHEELANKRFLIVLDDVWDHWIVEMLIPESSRCRNGGRVVVTTRIPNVAKMCNYVHHLSSLNPEDVNLRYDNMNSHLQIIFAYCAAIFQRDSAFTKDEVVRLWISEGFLDYSVTHRQSKNEWGLTCFDDLVLNNYFLRKNNSESTFVISRDFLKRVKFIGAYHVDKQIIEHHLPEDIRYLSLCFDDYDEVFRKIESLKVAKMLRTLLLMHPSGKSAKLSKSALDDLLRKLGDLRVLSLKGCSITELPNSIGKLTFLRYLDLSATGIHTLPDSIVGLVLLETLSIRQCRKTIRLPTILGELTNLRHLENSATSCILPTSLVKLKRLETLSEVVIVKGGFGLKELKSLKHLGGSLTISDLHNATLEGVASPCLEYKGEIHSLILHWGGKTMGGWTQQEDIAELLKPHGNLKKLEVIGYIGSKFPSWVRDYTVYQNLTSITINECWNCTTLPPLGQLSNLEQLDIRYLPEVQCIGDEFYGRVENPFSKLKTLTFDCMGKWKEWTGYGDHAPFSRLEKLKIFHCEILEKVSFISLPSLEDLDLRECGLGSLDSLLGFRFLPNLSIKVEYCSALKSLVPENQPLPYNIEEIKLLSCPNLVSLPDNLCDLVNCKRLEIRLCGKLVRFPKTGVPSNLESLEIHHCFSLESLPNNIYNISRLQKLIIIGCQRLNLKDGGDSLKKKIVMS